MRGGICYDGEGLLRIFKSVDYQTKPPSGVYPIRTARPRKEVKKPNDGNNCAMFSLLTTALCGDNPRVCVRNQCTCVNIYNRADYRCQRIKGGSGESAGAQYRLVADAGWRDGEGGKRGGA